MKKTVMMKAVMTKMVMETVYVVSTRTLILDFRGWEICIMAWICLGIVGDTE
jgi:hypothetical protein